MRLKLTGSARILARRRRGSPLPICEGVCRADANPCGARIEPVEIDWPLEQSYKWRDLVEAQRCGTVDASEEDLMGHLVLDLESDGMGKPQRRLRGVQV